MVRMSFFKWIKSKTAGRCLKTTVAFLLVVSALTNITFAWLEYQRENSLYSKNHFTVSADDLILETADGTIVDHLTMTDYCDELTECTSVDGRNIFFPLSDYASPYYSLSDDDLAALDLPDCYRYKFRESTPNDKNSKYISMEFMLTSDKDTSVWLTNESYILGAAADAVRLSIDYDANEQPCVFDSSLFEPEAREEVVSSIDSDGLVTCSEAQSLHPLSEYYYAGVEDSSYNVIDVANTPLFTLRAGVSRRIIVTVWLEGCDSDCDSKIYRNELNSKLQIFLRFTAGIKQPRVIKFSDYTFESWAYIKLQEGSASYDLLGEPEDYQELVDRRVFVRDTATSKLYAMTREVQYETATTPSRGENVFYQWSATLPSTVEKVEFVRIDYHDTATDRESSWEFWKAGEIKKVKGTPTLRFIALDSGSRGNETNNNGLWTNSTSIMTVYLSDNALQQSYATTIEYYVSFAYYGSANFTFTTKMTDISPEAGPKLYAVRIVAPAYQKFAFRQNEVGVSYTGLSRANRSLNLFTTKYENDKYSGAWSVDSTYPIR